MSDFTPILPTYFFTFKLAFGWQINILVLNIGHIVIIPEPGKRVNFFMTHLECLGHREVCLSKLLKVSHCKLAGTQLNCPLSAKSILLKVSS